MLKIPKLVVVAAPSKQGRSSNIKLGNATTIIPDSLEPAYTSNFSANGLTHQQPTAAASTAGKEEEVEEASPPRSNRVARSFCGKSHR